MDESSNVQSERLEAFIVKHDLDETGITIEELYASTAEGMEKAKVNAENVDTVNDSQVGIVEQTIERRKPPVRRKSYPVRFKVECINLFYKRKNENTGATTIVSVATELGLERKLLSSWLNDEKRITGGDKGKRKVVTTKRTTLLPFAAHLTSFICERGPDNKPRTTQEMVEFIKTSYPEFVREYYSTRKNGYDSLMRLCRRFAVKLGQVVTS